MARTLLLELASEEAQHQEQGVATASMVVGILDGPGDLQLPNLGGGVGDGVDHESWICDPSFATSTCGGAGQTTPGSALMSVPATPLLLGYTSHFLANSSSSSLGGVVASGSCELRSCCQYAEQSRDSCRLPLV